MKCYLCDKEKDTRPYGEGFQNICFECAMMPENKATTEAKFKVLLNAAGPVVVVGTQVGPFSADDCDEF